MARYGLEPIPDPPSTSPCGTRWARSRDACVVGVIGSIGVRRDPKAVPALVKLLGDPDAEVAQAAARSLGRIGTLEAATALEKALPNAPEANRLAVCEGLFRCADALRTQGQRQQRRAIYEQLRSASVPEYVKKGASRAEHSLRPPGADPIARLAATARPGRTSWPFSFRRGSSSELGLATVPAAVTPRHRREPPLK